ncbi:tetratricopeptide repeat protein [Nitrosospira multiformis]|uniref:tetratricopeptide repeat protein n=1 Tax=Nitrosospira multiformis TaxID=1231 RepID=UPI0034A50F0A
MREHVANAFVNKAVTLGQLGRLDEAIDCYDEVIGLPGCDRACPARTGRPSAGQQGGRPGGTQQK